MATTAATEIEYPSSDGQPMAETGIHVQAIILLKQALEDFFHDRPDVFIAADMFWYWKDEHGNTRNHAPDVMVVLGVGNHDRRSFFSWEENGAIPAVVFEMASAGTWKKDQEDKYEMYESLGVPEYFIFDPEDLYLSSPLKGYKLGSGGYRRLKPREGSIESSLGFRLRAEGPMLRLIDSKSGLPILTRAERAESAERHVQTERQRADEEKHRADALQAEVERLKAMLLQQGQANGNGS